MVAIATVIANSSRKRHIHALRAYVVTQVVWVAIIRCWAAAGCHSIIRGISVAVNQENATRRIKKSITPARC